jgi:hypothetical protein
LWVEGERPSSRLPLRSSGKRDRVKRLLWVGRAGATVDGGGSAGADAGGWLCSCCGWLPAGSATKTAREGGAEVAGTVRERDGVLKSMTDKGRMIAENRVFAVHTPHPRQGPGLNTSAPWTKTNHA